MDYNCDFRNKFQSEEGNPILKLARLRRMSDRLKPDSLGGDTGKLLSFFEPGNILSNDEPGAKLIRN